MTSELTFWRFFGLFQKRGDNFYGFVPISDYPVTTYRCVSVLFPELSREWGRHGTGVMILF